MRWIPTSVKRKIYYIDSTNEEIREIKSMLDNGDIVYTVDFVTIEYFTSYLFGKIYKKWSTKKVEHSHLEFKSIELAEKYAKIAECCDTNPDEDGSRIGSFESAIHIYPHGWKQLEKYGRFGIKEGQYHLMSEYDFDEFDDEDRLRFYYYDKNKYSILTHLKITDLFNEKYDEIINSIIKDTHLDANIGVIKSFNVTTHEYIPVNKLKASSKEIEELNQLLNEYYEKQQKYTEFLNKLYNASNG